MMIYKEHVLLVTSSLGPISEITHFVPILSDEMYSFKFSIAESKDLPVVVGRNRANKEHDLPYQR